MTSGLSRLLRPRSIAVIGGGTWCVSVLREAARLGHDGPVWPVHPNKKTVGGLPAFASVADLPETPDAAFIGVNRSATVDVLRALSVRGAGGAVCFASGFGEAGAELADGPALQAALLEAAGDMAVLGPNCYGFVNALDGVALWPDQHGLVPVGQGVAILCQSSNLALNLSMQQRGLPIAFLGTVGNQAQTDLARLGATLLDDDRITALGLYIEGIKDLRGFEALARKAEARGKQIVALKTGASEQARAGAVSHTASLAGSDSGARALLARLGVAQVATPGALLEALKLAHIHGRIRPRGVASMSCSGGEAALMADLGQALKVGFPPLTPRQKDALRAALGPKVALANPLDYHTYVWGDRAGMAAVFGAMMGGGAVDLGIVVLDFPREDRCDTAEWPMVVDAVAEVARDMRRPMAILASIAEGLPDAVCADMMARGVVPLSGMAEAMEAIAALGASRDDVGAPVLLPGPQRAGATRVLGEAEAKTALAAQGIRVPANLRAASVEGAVAAAQRVGFPVVLKREGEAHKSDSGGVVVGLTDADAVRRSAETMGGPFLIEEMIGAAIAELLVGVARDPAHGFVLTLAAGGILTEMLDDTVSMLLPVTAGEVRDALGRLRISGLLRGWRGAPPADMDAIVETVLAVQDWVDSHADTVEEVEINPLLCLVDGAVAVDALIRRREP